MESSLKHCKRIKDSRTSLGICHALLWSSPVVAVLNRDDYLNGCNLLCLCNNSNADTISDSHNPDHLDCSCLYLCRNRMGGDGIMKNPIFKAVLIGAVFYIALMILEGALHPAILPAAAVGAVILGLLATVFIWENEHTVHIGEVIVLWTMILLFAAYGLVFFFIGGVF